jgi:hypothetical protein
MKKNILLAVIIGVALTILPQPLSAQDGGDEEEIEFSVTGVDPDPIEPGYPKTPVLLPHLWQNGYLLDFHGTHADYVLRIVDATDNVVYFAVVPSYQAQIWLPTTLSGTYRIELISGNLLFYGYISL